MLAAKMLTDIVPDATLGNPLSTGIDLINCGVHPGFESREMSSII